MDTAQPQNNSSQATTGPVVSMPEAVSPATPPVKPPPQKSHKKLILGLLAVFWLLALGAGIYVFTMGSKQPTTDNSKLTSISPKFQPTIDPTADWKEYKNDQYSFKYPATAVLKENPDGSLEFNAEDGDARVTATFAEVKYTGKIYDYVRNKSKDSSKYTFQGPSSPIRNQEGYTYSENDMSAHHAYLYLNSTTALYIKYIYEGSTPILDQLFHSMEFTGSDQANAQNTVNFPNWKTYSNQLQEYSIKYPATYVVDPHSKENECYVLYSSQAVLDRQSQNPTTDELEITICSMEYTTNPPKTYSSLRAYVNDEDHESGLAVENVTWVKINTIEVAKEEMGDTDRYYWLHDGHVYYIDVQPNNSKLQKEADNILSTFKFTQ